MRTRASTRTRARASTRTRASVVKTRARYITIGGGSSVSQNHRWRGVKGVVFVDRIVADATAPHEQSRGGGGWGGGGGLGCVIRN